MCSFYLNRLLETTCFQRRPSFTSTSLFYTQLVEVSNHYQRPSCGVGVRGAGAGWFMCV